MALQGIWVFHILTKLSYVFPRITQQTVHWITVVDHLSNDLYHLTLLFWMKWEEQHHANSTWPARNIKGQLTIEDYRGCYSLHLQTAFVNIYIVWDHCNHERIALSTAVAFKRKKSIKFKVFCVDGAAEEEEWTRHRRCVTYKFKVNRYGSRNEGCTNHRIIGQTRKNLENHKNFIGGPECEQLRELYTWTFFAIHVGSCDRFLHIKSWVGFATNRKSMLL